jgi:hypothetical protein
MSTEVSRIELDRQAEIKKGYLLLIATMLIWGSFTLVSRMGA